MNERPLHVARAPGRLDVMGGNVDYVGGLVFQATIREATWAEARLREDDRVVLSNPQVAGLGWMDRLEFRLSDFSTEESVRALARRDARTHWTAYILGAFLLLRRRWPERVRVGVDVSIHSDVPLNKGVSSSAAIEVAVLKATASAYGIALSGVELAECCQWMENVIAESACGIMDQLANVLGDENCILPLLCQPAQPLPLVRLPQGLSVWGIDSGVSHHVSGLEYEAARAASFIGYRMICDWEKLPVSPEEGSALPRFTDPRWNGYLANISPSLFRSRYESRLPVLLRGADFLGSAREHADPFTTIRTDIEYRVRDCTRYSVEDSERVRLFVELVRCGVGFEQMGELMYQSHWSYSECGLGCEATDQIVDFVRAEGPSNGLYGARVTGGGAGGTVVVLGRSDAKTAFQRVVERYAQIAGTIPYVFSGSSIGADRFGVRVVNG